LTLRQGKAAWTCFEAFLKGNEGHVERAECQQHDSPNSVSARTGSPSHFLATGAVWQSVVLLAYGTFVMGLVDNLLRPLLVGKETEMPDYLVLISTLGGIATFGLSGFVIGPLVAALFIAIWDIFSASRRASKATPAK
jgi:AI-2E family transporter